MKFIISLITTSLLFFSGSLLAGSHGIKIMLSTKGPGAANPFWASVEKGAMDAAADLGTEDNPVELVILAPIVESDVMSQIATVEDTIAAGVDAIVIAPTDPSAVESMLQDAMGGGVKVVFIDTNGINPGVTFIGTNNEAGAGMAAQYICDNVGEGSKVAILQGVMTQTTAVERADGSHAGLEACGLNIVAEISANWDTAQGMSVTEDIISGNPDIKAIFASNDNMALGAIQALKNNDMLDDVVVVGFDANPDAAESVAAGEMSATIAQFSYNMGYMGVENALKLVNDESIPDNIDTGTLLVTADNAADFM